MYREKEGGKILSEHRYIFQARQEMRSTNKWGDGGIVASPQGRGKIKQDQASWEDPCRGGLRGQEAPRPAGRERGLCVE